MIRNIYDMTMLCGQKYFGNRVVFPILAASNGQKIQKQMRQ